VLARQKVLVTLGAGAELHVTAGTTIKIFSVFIHLTFLLSPIGITSLMLSLPLDQSSSVLMDIGCRSPVDRNSSGSTAQSSRL
jgi:hypothetical protein